MNKNIIYKIVALVILIITLIVFVNRIFSSNNAEKKFIRTGNEKYKDTIFNDAEVNYRKAIEQNINNHKAEFNLADALYKQENYKETIGRLETLSTQKIDSNLLENIFYNLGNSYFNNAKQLAESQDPKNAEEAMGNLKKSLEAFKNALKIMPSDTAARQNYQIVKHILDQQEQQNKDDKNKDKKKDDKQDKKDKKDKEKQDKDKKDKKGKEDKQDKKKKEQDKGKQNKDKKEDKKDKQDKKGQDKKEQQKQGQGKQKQQKISKKDAERLLKALQNQEKMTLKKMKKQKKNNRTKTEKNW